MNKIPPLLLLLFVLSASHPAVAEDLSPVTRFSESMRTLEEVHRVRVRSLVDLYTQHLERLLGEVQAEGDLETLLSIRAEVERVRQRPYEAVDSLPEPLLRTREIYEGQLKNLTREYRREQRKMYEAFLPLLDDAVRQLTREGELDRAAALLTHREEAEKRLAELLPEPREEETKPEGPAPGRGLLEGAGSFDDGKGWHILKPPGNNSRIYSVPQSGKNNVLRVEFVGNRGIHIQRHVPLQAGRRYRIQWRARMHRPWDEQVGPRQRPPLMMELHVHPNVWVNLPEGERNGLRHRSFAIAPLPPGVEWVEQHVDLTAGKHMDQLNIRFPPAGDHILFLDDVEIRELPDPQADIKP